MNAGSINCFGFNKQESALQIYDAIQDISKRDLSNREAIFLLDGMIKAYKLIFGEKPKTEEKTVSKEISSYDKNESVESKEIKKVY